MSVQKSVASLSGPVVILGGAGFIGTRLTSLLRDNGQTVRIGDIRRSEACCEISAECDVRDVAAVEEFVRGAGVIINLAAEHRDDVRPLSRYHEVNVGGAVHVYRAACRTGVQKIVFTSSVAVYGFHRQAVALKVRELLPRDRKPSRQTWAGRDG